MLPSNRYHWGAHLTIDLEQFYDIENLFTLPVLSGLMDFSLGDERRQTIGLVVMQVEDLPNYC
jgi:hypothetical protein